MVDDNETARNYLCDVVGTVPDVTVVGMAYNGRSALVKLRKGTKLEITESIDTTGFVGVGIYFLIFILYWLTVPHLGFLIATPFTVFAVAYLLGGRSWIPMIAISITTPVFIFYGCSQYLRVFLPTWSLS